MLSCGRAAAANRYAPANFGSTSTAYSSRRNRRRSIWPATSGAMSTCRCGRSWMAWSRLASASSERKPNESARATSPGMGVMSASLSTAAGARFCADVRSRTAAAKASANPRAAALLRNAVVTAPMIASARSPTQKRSGGGPLPATPTPSRCELPLQVDVVQVVRRLARRVVRVGRAVTAGREHARVAGDAPLVHRRVGVDVALRGGHEVRGRRGSHASGAAAGRRGVRLVEGAAVLERVHLDTGVGGRLGDDRVGAVLDGARGGEEVGVPVVALRLEAHFARQRREAVLLLEERLLRREDGLEVRLRFALLRPRLELDEVRDRDGREDADDRNDDHQLNQRKALLDELLHWGLRGSNDGRSNSKLRARQANVSFQEVHGIETDRHGQVLSAQRQELSAHHGPLPATASTELGDAHRLAAAGIGGSIGRSPFRHLHESRWAN